MQQARQKLSPDISSHILAPLIHGMMEPPAVPTSPGKGRSKLITSHPSSTDINGEGNTIDDELQRYATVVSLVKQFRDTGGVHQLRAHARQHGVPGALRTVVWPILLAHHPYVVSRSILAQFPASASSHSSGGDSSSPGVPVKRIRAELSRYHRRQHHRRYTQSTSTTPSSTSGSEHSSPSETYNAIEIAAHDTAVERAVVSFLSNHKEVEFSFGMVHVCLTLAQWLMIPTSTDACAVEDSNLSEDALTVCFEQMMHIMLWSPTPTAPVGPADDMSTQHISDFLTAFRKLMPDLAVYFSKEEVGTWGDEWVFTWIQWWCARELGKDEKGRLWDWYLGWGDNEEEGPNEWHVYVCLALLRYCRDALEELETSEIRTLLGQLPPIEGMDTLLDEARRIRSELKELDQKEDEAMSSNSASSSLPILLKQ